jgi:5-methylcytosine-specific restriction endonuclease McrA
MFDQDHYTKIPIISRNEARERDLIRYYTGKPCKRGHLAERFTSSANCVECIVKYRSDNAAEIYQRRKSYNDAYLKNYTKVNKNKLTEYRKEYRKINKLNIYAINKSRRAKRLNAMPKWVDLESIKEIYKEADRISKETNIEHHVDHVIPLVHPLVCGLHVPWNLQILTAEENLKKSNKFEIE